MRYIQTLTCLLASILLLGACTRIAPLDFDDAAQKKLLERDRKKWADEDAALAKNRADSAKIAEENAKLYEAYLEDLRAYKKTNHMVMFGWFAYWNPTSPDITFSLDHLPDSVDFVSNWGGWNNLSEIHMQQLKRLQKKGTKMTIGWIVESVGDGINHDRKVWPDDPHEAIDAYVTAICDSITKYGYDGFDLDYEPQFSSPFKAGRHCGDGWSDANWADRKPLISCEQSGNKDYENYFFRKLREKLGPDKLLNINGSIGWVDPKVVDVFDYFIAQSYNGTAQGWHSTAQSHLFPAGVKPEQIIYTETFQTNKSNADKFVSRYAEYVVKSLGGKAGGIGAFHINEDYLHGPDYKNIKAAIQMMNPAFTE